MRQVYRIIQAVRERPYLYDQSSQTFKHMGSKGRQWMEVAKLVYGKEDKATVNKVKIQWKSLRDAYVKHQRKQRASTTRIKPYIYEEEMRFLQPHIHSRDRDDYDHDPNIDSLPMQNFDVKTEDYTASVSGDSQTEIEQEPEPQVIDVPNGFLWEDQSTQQSKPAQCKDALTHPVDAFFHGIAQTVKQLRPATIARIKKTVANVVMDAELEEIEESNSQKNPLLPCSICCKSGDLDG